MFTPPTLTPKMLEELQTFVSKAGKEIKKIGSSAVAKAAKSVTGGAAPAASATTTSPTKVPDINAKGHQLERPIGHVRFPVVLTTSAWMAQDKFIGLWVNPLSASWSINRRETSTKTAAGVVRNTWRNRYRNTYYDEYTIAFTFQTGNIMPSAGIPDRVLNDATGRASTLQGPAVPPGLIDFYKFGEMVDQPMLLGQMENRHHIYYRSRVFPRIHLEGYFVGETATTFTENAEGNANQLQWTATFQVYKSDPPINNYQQLVASWTAVARSEMMSEIFSPELISSPSAFGLGDEYDNNKAGNKPLPTVRTGATGSAGAKELSTSSQSGKKIGIVSGSVKGQSKAALNNPMNPEILTSAAGKLFPKLF